MIPTRYMEKFWAKVERGEPSACWLWKGAVGSTGYGVYSTKVSGKKKSYGAHRFAWLLTHGPIEPATLQVCHRCDVPLCVNPGHLFLGTQFENMADMIAKGRQYREGRDCHGELNGRAKLKQHQVEDIRRAINAGRTSRVVAERFGVSKSTVLMIARGERWDDAGVEL